MASDHAAAVFASDIKQTVGSYVASIQLGQVLQKIFTKVAVTLESKAH